MPIMRRRGKEQAVFETGRNIADGTGDLGIDRVARTARGRGVVRLVKDQQGLRRELSKPVAQARGVDFVDEQAMRDQEAGVGGPGIDRKSALAAHTRHIRPVENAEREAETGLHLVLPLIEHRGRACDNNPFDAAAQQQFARDQPGLDGLAEPDVVGNEQVDARQPKRLAQRVELVGVDANAGAEGRLKEIGVGRGHAVPRQGAEIGRKQRRIVETLIRHGGPAAVLQDAGVDLVFPQYRQRLALRVVVKARQIDKHGFVA